MGVRRSSLIIFCDKDDQEILQAKQNLYKQDSEGNWTMDVSISNRTLSNNTVIYTEKPSMEELQKHFELIRASGEPGLLHHAEMQRRNPHAKGTNPCGEILLDDRQTCNLTEINMSAFVREDGSVDMERMLHAQRLSAKIGYRMATIELELHEWDKAGKKDMLTGCSLSGMADFLNKTQMSNDDFAAVLRKLRKVAREEVDEMAEKLKMGKTLLVTAIKPSGSLSLLPGISAGIHFQHSDYYIRRVRVNEADPLSRAMTEMGFASVPENGQTEENCSTRVFAFPMKSPKGATKFDVGAIRQLELYKLVMENYVDHNASNTISVSPEEWDETTQWVYDNWDSVVGMTFLELQDEFYQLAPFEKITKEKYESMLATTPKFVAATANSMEDFSDLLAADIEECSGGYCPVR
mgnify:FL=1